MADYQAPQLPDGAYASHAGPWMPLRKGYAQEGMAIDDADEVAEDSGSDVDNKGKGKGMGKAERKKIRHQVKVREVKRLMHPNQWVFKAVDGKEKTTEKADWKEKRGVFEYKGKRVTYWCKPE